MEYLSLTQNCIVQSDRVLCKHLGQPVYGAAYAAFLRS